MTKIGDIIETPSGELDYLIGPEGNPIKLGLLLPDADSPQVFTPFRLHSALLDLAQIQDLLARDGRRKARDIWGPEFIKDQDGIGACQGYASASCIEKVRWLGGQDYVKLSGDFAYSLVNGGRDRGSQLANGFQAASDHGYCPEDTPGLRRWEFRKSNMPQAAFESAKRFRGFEGYYCETEQELYTALALGYVGVIATHVGGAYSRLDRHGISQGGNGVGNHAVCADDLVWNAQLGKLMIDSPNSWKTSWGDQGRCYYLFDQHLRQTIKNHRFYVFPAATQDSDGNNPPPLRMA
jgi:hypothetical protein